METLYTTGIVIIYLPDPWKHEQIELNTIPQKFRSGTDILCGVLLRGTRYNIIMSRVYLGLKTVCTCYLTLKKRLSTHCAVDCG